MGADVIKAPDGKTWIFGSNTARDLENDVLTKTLYVNGSTSIPAWLNYDLSDFSFWVVTSSNSYVGVYNITVEVDDGYNTPAETEFSLTIEENLVPVRLKSIPNYEVVNSQVLTIEFDPIDELFDDPEDRPMIADVIFANGNPLPDYMIFDSATNTLTVSPTDIEDRVYTIAYRSSDDHDLTSDIVFDILVEGKITTFII